MEAMVPRLAAEPRGGREYTAPVGTLRGRDAVHDGGRLPRVVVILVARQGVGDRVDVVGERAHVVRHAGYVASQYVEIAGNLTHIAGDDEQGIDHSPGRQQHGEDHGKRLAHRERFDLTTGYRTRQGTC